jgi:hypothetical protein
MYNREAPETGLMSDLLWAGKNIYNIRYNTSIKLKVIVYYLHDGQIRNLRSVK